MQCGAKVLYKTDLRDSKHYTDPPLLQMKIGLL